jgi:hypothetical protein
MQRIDRTLRHLVSQDTARANAAEATAKLRKRREEHEEVDAYLRARVGVRPDVSGQVRPDVSVSAW